VRLPPQVFTQGLTASLSFTSSFTKGLLYLRSFTATLFGGAVTSIGTQTNTDNFNRANQSPISGNGWTDKGNAILTSNAVTALTPSSDGQARYSSWAGGDDQYSQGEITVTGTSAGAGIGPAVRCSTDANKTLYRLVIDAAGNYELSKFISAAFTSLRTGTLTYVAGQKLGLSATGGATTTLKIWYNNVQIGTDVTDSSSPITTGQPGFGYSSTVTTAVFDNWDAGTSGGGGPSVVFSRKPLKALTATFSVVAASNRKIIDSGFSATFSTVAALTKRIVDSGFSATLSFIGNLAVSKTFVRALSATLSFSGALSRRTGKALSATLSFVGTLAKNVRKTYSATLSFIGNLATTFIAGGGHVFTQTLTATMSFVGAFTKLPQKIFTPAFSPVAALTRKTSHLLTATLSFIGALAKWVRDAGFAATLSFSGFLSASKSFLKSLTATLSFAGSVTARIIATRAFTATLSFVGASSRRTNKLFTATFVSAATLVKRIADAGFTAALTFSAGIAKNIRDAGFAATLAFTGFLAASKSFLKSFAATLSSAGNLVTAFIPGTHLFTQAFTATFNATATLSRSTGKRFNATLSSAASLIKRVAHIFSAILAPIGALVKAFRDAGFTATLSFAGTLSTVVAHFFTRSFAATVSFVGTLTRTRVIVRLFTATLTMSGTIWRKTTKVFAATLSSSPALRKGIRKIFGAVLSFAGFLFRGGVTIFLAGQRAGAALIGILAGSTVRIGKAGSELEVREAESGTKIPVTGSQLRAERTK
jgi:hypothetical protein